MKRTSQKKTRVAVASLALTLCLAFASALAGTVTVRLIDSQGNPISGGAVRTYYEGSKGSTDANGTLIFNDARAVDTVYLKYGGHEVNWPNQNISANPTFTAQTTKATVDLKSCTTGLSLASTADQWGNLPTFRAYYSGPIVGGSIEILPGTETFYVKWETREVSMPGIVIGDGGLNHNGVIGNGATQPITFNTTKVTLSGSNIKFRANSPISADVPFSSPMEMLPGDWEFVINGVRQTLTIAGCAYPPPAPEIVLYDGVVMMSASELLDGQTTPVDFCTVPLGSRAPREFTVYNDGNGVLNIGSVSFSGASDFSVSGMPSSVQPGASATFTVTFTPAAIGERSATLHIADNDANENTFDYPVIGTGVSANTAATINCADDATLDCAPSTGLPVTVAARITDPDSSQTLTVTLKQAATLLDTRTVSSPADNALVTFNPVTMLPGSHPLTVEVSDGTDSASCNTTITVNEDKTKPVITLTGPSSLTLECHLDTYTEQGATVVDACDTALTAASVGGQTVNVNVPGTYVVTYDATDASGNAALQVTRTVTVVDTSKPVITLNGLATVTLECHVQTYTELGANVADACDTALTAATVGGQTVNANVPGTYVVTYNAKDASGNAAAPVTRTVNVVDTTPPYITCPGNKEVNADPLLCSAVVAGIGPASAGDNSPSYAITYLLEGATTGSGVEDASGVTFNCGITKVTYTVTDAAGLKASCSFNVNVLNPSPVVTLTGPACGSIYAVNTPVNFTATFTDVGGGTHCGTWTFDSISQAATIVEPSTTPGTAKATRTFTSPGVYTVKLTVTDSCGASCMGEQIGGVDVLAVVYDPTGGFVTGGGWIESPPGAYAADPSLTGKANFGFVSKYQKGATVPTGNTEFQFKAGNLNFQSTDYQYLVIAGAKAQYKGRGTINGAGSYQFLLTATDGQIAGGGGVDRFRLKITSGTGVIYDNAAGTDDIDTSSQQALGGGSIVIHKQ